MAQAETFEGLRTATIERIPDAREFAVNRSASTKKAAFVLCLAAGLGTSVLWNANAYSSTTLTTIMIPMAVAGGLLSTWSPCGYSSICLLRPNGRWSVGSVVAWTPTLLAHLVGYILGAVVLGGVLGLAGNLLGLNHVIGYALPVFALLMIIYGAHQFDFLPVPYPQRRCQVPHDARQRFRKWVIGLLYGFSLGLNYLTYVQTPLLYAATGAALFSGSPVFAIGIFLAFNAGRFAPVMLNALPISDARITAWLARHQQNAAFVDGMLLVGIGALITGLVVL